MLKAISIHALLAESDDHRYLFLTLTVRFQSTLSLRRATRSSMALQTGIKISIHALLAESDFSFGSILLSVIISIHALLAESDPMRETGSSPTKDFNPRSPCGERLFPAHVLEVILPISIHALLAESDGQPDVQRDGGGRFQSTLSLRRATLTALYLLDEMRDFNPRSPCGERRSTGSPPTTAPTDFNPRSPCGERRGTMLHTAQFPVNFNPRSPCGERRPPAPPRRYNMDFNPRSPCGERRRCKDECSVKDTISIHALLAESDSAARRSGNVAR